MPNVQKSWKSWKFSPNTNFISNYSSVHVEGILTIVLKFLLQNSKNLLLRHLKGVEIENCSEKTSEWFTVDAKCSFDNSAEKHSAKSQNVFRSKSGNVIKKVSFGNFPLHQNKLLFRYVEGSFDNRAEFSSSKARIFFWLNSRKDTKCKEFFSKTNFRSKNSSVHEECSFEKTVPKFLGRLSQHLLFISRKGSKYEKCSENVSEWSSGDAKCNFENQCRKKYAVSPKNLGPYSGNDLKKPFLTEHWLSTKWSFVQTENNFHKRTRGFRKDLKVWGFNPKKSQETLFFFRVSYPLEMTLSPHRSQFWKPCRTFFPPKMRFNMPKVQKSKKVEIFVQKPISSRYARCTRRSHFDNCSETFAPKFQIFVAQTPKGC